MIAVLVLERKVEIFSLFPSGTNVLEAEDLPQRGVWTMLSKDVIEILSSSTFVRNGGADRPDWFLTTLSPVERLVDQRVLDTLQQLTSDELVLSEMPKGKWSVLINPQVYKHVLARTLHFFIHHTSWGKEEDAKWYIAFPLGETPQRNFVDDAAFYGLIMDKAPLDELLKLLLDPHRGGFAWEEIEEAGGQVLTREVPVDPE